MKVCSGLNRTNSLIKIGSCFKLGTDFYFFSLAFTPLNLFYQLTRFHLEPNENTASILGVFRLNN